MRMIDNPAIIMNEAAFRILVEALNGSNRVSPNLMESITELKVDDAQVDNFLKSYEKHKTTNYHGNFADVADAVEEITRHGRVMMGYQIGDILRRDYGINYSVKQIGSMMKNVNNHKPHIKKIGRGQYVNYGIPDPVDEIGIDEHLAEMNRGNEHE